MVDISQILVFALFAYVDHLYFSESLANFLIKTFKLIALVNDLEYKYFIRCESVGIL